MSSTLPQLAFGGAVGALAGFLLGPVVARSLGTKKASTSEGLAIVGGLAGAFLIPSIAMAKPAGTTTTTTTTTTNNNSSTSVTQIPPPGAIGDS